MTRAAGSAVSLPDNAACKDESQTLSLALDALDQGVAVLGERRVVLTCNRAWQAWHETVLGARSVPGAPLDAPGPTLTARRLDWWQQYLALHEAANGRSLPLRLPDGREFRVRVTRETAGRTVATVEDVTRNRREESDLRRTVERFRAFAESSGDWFWEIDAGMICTLHTTATAADMARDGNLLGVHFVDHLRGLAVDPAELEPVTRCIAAREPFQDCEVRVRDDTDGEQVTSLSGKPFSADDGAFAGYRGSARNVTRAHLRARRLAYQARHDDLTGLANRRALEARITKLLANRARRSNRPALCYLDLDQFKVINDTCGRSAGDALLNRVAAMLRDGLRGADTIARLGGDEFGVLLRNCEAGQAEKVAEKLRRAVAKQPFIWEGQQFTITGSIGVVPLGGNINTAGDALQAADSACFAAKERGRNRVKVYALDDSTLNLKQGEMHWVARIHSALAEERLELHVQPIAPTRGDDPAHLHFEALLRMQGRDGRQFSPGAFLPAAERYNLATQIDAWVLGAALDWLDRAPLFLDHLHTLSVNLSGQSLGESSFLELVKERLRRHPHAARKLCFEVTETAAISNLDRAQEFIAAVRAFGCTFALDDFGAGLSSFAYLRTLDVDYLKIDGMFVKDCHVDPIHRAMVRSINEVGHVMGKKTIAEFVETDEIRDALLEIGVDYVQGYGIGKPVPFGDVV